MFDRYFLDDGISLSGGGRFSVDMDPRQDISVRTRVRLFVSPTTTATAAQLAQKEFQAHARKWIKDTRFSSSPSEKYLHPSYARIIGMGLPAVPFILREMEKRQADWFYALRAITGENPVTNDMAGDVAAMTKAWLEWGQKKKANQWGKGLSTSKNYASFQTSTKRITT